MGHRGKRDDGDERSSETGIKAGSQTAEDRISECGFRIVELGTRELDN